MLEKEAPPEIFLTSFNKKVYSALLERMKSSEKFSLSLLADEFSAEEMGRISGIEALNREHSINRNVFNDCVQVLKNHKSVKSDNLSDDDLKNLFKSKSKK